VENKDQLIQAAELLRDHCNDQERCWDCIFCDQAKYENDNGSWCKLFDHPDTWSRIRPPRWTLEELGLAKSLKNCGAARLIKSLHCTYVIFEEDKPGTKPWRLPPSTFAALKPGTAIAIDDLIEEADR